MLPYSYQKLDYSFRGLMHRLQQRVELTALDEYNAIAVGVAIPRRVGIQNRFEVATPDPYSKGSPGKSSKLHRILLFGGRDPRRSDWHFGHIGVFPSSSELNSCHSM